MQEDISNMENKKKLHRHLSRRQFLKYGVYGSLPVALASSLWLNGCSRRSRKKPNLIIISIDTLRADHIGCYGYQRPTSPAIDKFASEALLFEDVMSTSPWTLPAHGSLLTGLYPNRHGLKSYDNTMPGGIRMLADILKESGYATAAVVNSHCLSTRYGFNQGFDAYAYLKEVVFQRGPSKVGEEGIKRLRSRPDRPFFLFLHYFDVHSDYSSLPYYEQQFVRPYNGIANGSSRQLSAHCIGEITFDQAAADHLIDLYDAGIRQMDDGIDALLKSLKSQKLLDDSILIITSDHGEEFLEHGGVLHSQTQYQELLHIPLIIKGPGIPKSKRIKSVVSLVDVVPTVLSLLGIAEPESLDGVDLCPLWQEREPQFPSRYLFAGASKLTGPDQRSKYHDTKRAVRHPRYKLHYDRLTKQAQLYDLQYDQKEKTNVASSHGPLVSSMLSQLKIYTNVNEVGVPLEPLSPEELQTLKSLGYL